jgi:hypothetical protein
MCARVNSNLLSCRVSFLTFRIKHLHSLGLRQSSGIQCAQQICIFLLQYHFNTHIGHQRVPLGRWPTVVPLPPHRKPTWMGPTDISRLFSWASVVDEDSPSTDTTQGCGLHSTTRRFCLFGIRRPRPMGPATPRPRPCMMACQRQRRGIPMSEPGSFPQLPRYKISK